jgi:hypothetical protein
MDSMANSKVGQVAFPLAAGLGASTSPYAARGIVTGLGVANRQAMMREQQQAEFEKRRLGEMFAGQIGMPDVQSSDSTASDTRPEYASVIKAAQHAFRLGDLDAGIRAMTEIAKLSSNERMQRHAVDGSLMDPNGKVLGTAPVREPFDNDEGYTLNRTTGEISELPSTTSEITRKDALAESEIGVDQSRVGANEALARQRAAVAEHTVAKTDKLVSQGAGSAGADPNDLQALRNSLLQEMKILSANPALNAAAIEQLGNKLKALDEVLNPRLGLAVPQQEQPKERIQVQRLQQFQPPQQIQGGTEYVFNPATGKIEPKG